jgi:hypothetical protein
VVSLRGDFLCSFPCSIAPKLHRNKARHLAKLIDQLKWLAEIGFDDVDVLWKQYNFAVYGGAKGTREGKNDPT